MAPPRVSPSPRCAPRYPVVSEKMMTIYNLLFSCPGMSYIDWITRNGGDFYPNATLTGLTRLDKAKIYHWISCAYGSDIAYEALDIINIYIRFSLIQRIYIVYYSLTNDNIQTCMNALYDLPDDNLRMIPH